MSRHVTDHARPRGSIRSVARFLELDRIVRADGLSRLLTRLDRARRDRRSSRLPVYLRIDRGIEA